MSSRAIVTALVVGALAAAAAVFYRGRSAQLDGTEVEADARSRAFLVEAGNDVPGSGQPRESTELQSVETDRTADGRQAARRSLGGAHGSEDSNRAAREDEASGVRTSVVRFEVTGSLSEGRMSSIRICPLTPETDGEVHTVEIPIVTAPSAELVWGDYVAAVHEPEMGHGAIVAFTVGPEESTVVLAAPFRFDVELAVIDAETRAPIEAAAVQFERSDRAAAWTSESARVASTNPAGLARVKAITPGRWRLTAEAQGYGSTTTEFDYPGSQEEAARGDELIRLGPVNIPALLPVHFQLVDTERWDDLTEFTVALVEGGEPVSFDDSGHATLELGWYVTPLYVKIDYPGARDSIRYLDGGLPPTGTAHEIDIGGDQLLEVDLVMDPEILEQVRDLQPFLAVSYRARNLDATKTGFLIEEPGLFEFRGVHGSTVVVSLETTDGDLPVDWASRRVDLEAEGVTSCRLVVDTPPARIRIKNGDGVAAAGVHCEVLQVPNDTTWAAGGLTDADGMLQVGRVREGETALFAYREHGPTLGIEIPLDLTDPAPVLDVPLDPALETYVDVECGTQSVPDVEVVYSGERTGHPFHFGLTGTDGRTESFRLVSGSRAVARVVAANHWCAEPEFDLQSGRNHVRVLPTGLLRIRDFEHSERVRSLEFGATLAEWIDSGATDVDGPEDGPFLCRVPVGAYEVLSLSGEPLRIELRESATVTTGL